MAVSQKDTFNAEGINTPLECIEWDDLWFQNANDTDNKKRVLLIGDSISRAYRSFLNEMYNGKVFIDQLSTSKALDNKHFKALIDYALLHIDRDYDAIVFNNAAHGYHLEKDEYEKYYRETVSHVIKTNSNSTVIISLGTPVRDKADLNKMSDAWYEKMLGRNDAAKKIAKEFNLEVNDLYSVAEHRSDIYWSDGVHFSDEGCTMLAKTTYNTLKKIGI